MATPQHFQYKIENYIQARDRQNEKDIFASIAWVSSQFGSRLTSVRAYS